MRVALFGGTFDPPHLGHVAIARAAADAFGLDTVLFAPAGVQPLKGVTGVSGYGARLRMCGLLEREDGRFLASDVDAPRGDGRPNYTVDTLQLLRERVGDAEVFSLVGADSFLQLGHWREPEKLLAMAEWIVVSRPGFRLAEPVGMALTEAQRGRVHLLDAVHMDVSATELRARLAAGDPCEGVLTAGVAAYIVESGLYSGSMEV